MAGEKWTAVTRWLGEANLALNVRARLKWKQEALFLAGALGGFAEHLRKGCELLVEAADAADALASEIDRANRLSGQHFESRRLESLAQQLADRLRACWGWGRSKLDGRDGDWLSAAIELVHPPVALSRPDLSIPDRSAAPERKHGDPSAFRAYAGDLRAVSDALMAGTIGPNLNVLRRRRGRPKKDSALHSLARWAAAAGVDAERVAKEAVAAGFAVEKYTSTRSSPRDSLAAWTNALVKAGAPPPRSDACARAMKLIEAEPGIHTERLIAKLGVAKKRGRATIDELVRARKAKRLGRRGLYPAA